MEPIRIERKLAAILYADVADYSRLTGEDEVGTHRALSAHLDAIAASIEAHGGRVVHYAGDAVLADFGSVVDALSCAVDVQRDLATRTAGIPEKRRLRFRIGINLGEVIVDRNDIYGDGVNVAARLESLADPGGICISQTVHDQVHNKLDLEYQYLGEQKVKNIARPVRHFRVVLDPHAAPVKSRLRGFGRRLRTLPGLTGKRLVAATVLLVVLWAVFGPPQSAPPPLQIGTPTLAVLPFRVIGGDREQDIFSEGLTEDLIAVLYEQTGLKVVSGGSALASGGAAPSAQEVGRELGSRYVMEGSVRRDGDKLRITAMLVDAETGFNLWGGRYDRIMTDVLALQDEVSAKIVDTLAIKLAEAERERLAVGVGAVSSAGGYLIRGLENLGRLAEQAILLPGELYDRVFGSATARPLK